jgi:hypothetical protein
VGPTNIRVDGKILKGYKREDLADVWSRYVAASEDRDIQSSKRIPTELVGNETEPLPSSDSCAASATPLHHEEPPYEESYFRTEGDCYQSDEELIAMIERVFSD